VTTRALVVGLGAIGQRHARNLRSLLGAELELSALRSRKADLVISPELSAVAGDPGADCDGGVFTDLDAALGHSPDLVFICTPTSLHVPTALAAVDAGAAVFIEKPLSGDYRGVAALLEATARREAVVAVGCQMRFHPALVRLRKLVADQVLGSLLRVDVEQAEYLPAWHPYEDYRTSYAAVRALGGGCVLTQIHELDYIQWIFGDPQRVFAVGGRFGSLDIDVEDTASAVLVHSCDGRELAVHLSLDYLQRPPRRSCHVVGELGVIDVDLRAPSLVWTDNDGKVTLEEHYDGFERQHLFLAETQAFLDAAGGRRAPEVELEHAATTLRIALAMRASMESGLAQPCA
jgi:predicted dehydrogenase